MGYITFDGVYDARVYEGQESKVVIILRTNSCTYNHPQVERLWVI